MKKLLLLFTFLIMTLPSFAVTATEIGKAKVQIGPLRVNIKNSKEDQQVSISKTDNIYTFACEYAKIVFNGLKISSTLVSVVLQFDSIEGELEAGKTYDLSNSAPTFLNTMVTAVKLNNFKITGISTLEEEIDSETPVATGKFRVDAYDPETQEITGDLAVTVAPTILLKGNRAKFTTEPQKVKMKITTVVE